MSALTETIKGPESVKTDRSFRIAENSDDVANRLLRYIRRRLHLSTLNYAAPPEALPNGWETYTYRFRLAKTPGLPASYARPLILRIYASSVGVPCARQEWLFEEYLAPMGYPVARCLFLEQNCRTFGGPFLVSEQAGGECFPDYLYHHPWHILELPQRMGRLHAELHQIPVDERLRKPRPFLDRQIVEIGRLIQEHTLADLAPGLAWLKANRPIDQEPEAILHLDFHPLNLLYDGVFDFTVLDWSQADVGDRYADVAVAKMFMDCMQIQRSGWWQRFNFWGGRLFLRRGYLIGYNECLPLMPEKLAYFCAWAALRRLCLYGAWLRTGVTSWWKPASLGHLTREHIDVFCKYFHHSSGVHVALPVPSQAICGDSTQPAREISDQ